MHDVPENIKFVFKDLYKSDKKVQNKAFLSKNVFDNYHFYSRKNDFHNAKHIWMVDFCSYFLKSTVIGNKA